MNEGAGRRSEPHGDEEMDPALERILQGRKPGEIETGMMTRSEDGNISATERFAGQMSREEALRLLAPDGDEPDE
jgi:hypothetical protein